MSKIRKSPHSSNISLQHNSYAHAKGLVDPNDVQASWDKGESIRPSHPETATDDFTPYAEVALSSAGERFLSDRMVAERYGVSKQTIWRWSQGSSNFPKPIKFEGGTTRWRLSDLIAYERQVMGGTPEERKALSRNLGHEHYRTTEMYYGALEEGRQHELVQSIRQRGEISLHHDILLPLAKAPENIRAGLLEMLKPYK